MYTDVIILHEKVKALANKEMVALKRVKVDGKLGAKIWVNPQRVLERTPEKVGTIEKEPAALELLVSQQELDQREEEEKEKRAQARQRYEEKAAKQKSGKKAAKDKGSAIRRAAKKAAAALSAGFALYVAGSELQLYPGKSTMARAPISRGGNPQGGTDFILNQSEPRHLVESDEACLYRTHDTGHANVPMRPKEEIEHPIAMLKGECIMGAESMPETGFTSLRTSNTSGERDSVMDKLPPDDAALAEAYFGQADEVKDAHWPEGIGQGAMSERWNSRIEPPRFTCLVGLERRPPEPARKRPNL